MPRFFCKFFIFTELVENCIKSTVFGRKNKNLCHATEYYSKMRYFKHIFSLARARPIPHLEMGIAKFIFWNPLAHLKRVILLCLFLLSRRGSNDHQQKNKVARCTEALIVVCVCAIVDCNGSWYWKLKCQGENCKRDRMSWLFIAASANIFFTTTTSPDTLGHFELRN